MNNSNETYFIGSNPDKEVKINADDLSTRLSQIKAFPNSLRLFEDIFSNGLELIKSHGIKNKNPKGLLFHAYDIDLNSLGIFYKFNWDTDYLHFQMHNQNDFRNIGLTRKRINLLGQNYVSEINGDNNFKENFLEKIFGERHPYSSFEMDKKNKLLWTYYYKNQKFTSHKK